MMMQLFPVITELINEGYTVKFRPGGKDMMNIVLSKDNRVLDQFVHMQSVAAMKFDGMYEQLRLMQALFADQSKGL